MRNSSQRLRSFVTINCIPQLQQNKKICSSVPSSPSLTTINSQHTSTANNLPLPTAVVNTVHSMLTNADEILSRGGLYLDELAKRLRILHPDDHEMTQDLMSGCVEFMKCSTDFHSGSGNLLRLLVNMAETTDGERMDVIGKRSRLLMEISERHSKHEKMQAILNEKEAHLERLKKYHESLKEIMKTPYG